jgi:hypothetical protein
MWDEGELRTMAEDRYGLVDRRTVLWAGLSDHYISTQLELRRWKQPHPGVYYLNATPLNWRGHVMAAVLAGGDDALASHRTAGVLWGLEGFWTRAIEITVPFSDEPVPERSIVHRTRRILPAAEVEGIPVTSVERTLLDLAASLPAPILEKAVMSGLRKDVTSAPSLAETLVEQGGRGVKGTRRLRQVLQLVDDGLTGSVAEVEAAQIIRDLPIPRPVRQHRVRLPNGSNAYPDFSWPKHMKIVEVDGYGAHGTPEQLREDLLRQNLLMDLGWEIRRFSVDRIRSEPLLVREEILAFVLK